MPEEIDNTHPLRHIYRPQYPREYLAPRILSCPHNTYKQHAPYKTMPSVCYICKKPATFCMKGSDLYYCEIHAKACFADLAYLQKIAAETDAMQQLLK